MLMTAQTHKDTQLSHHLLRLSEWEREKDLLLLKIDEHPQTNTLLSRVLWMKTHQSLWYERSSENSTKWFHTHWKCLWHTEMGRGNPRREKKYAPGVLLYMIFFFFQLGCLIGAGAAGNECEKMATIPEIIWPSAEQQNGMTTRCEMMLVMWNVTVSFVC